ncbi:helix-turn-helix domain-containing protein [Rhizobium lentis]|uniref:DNA-binding MarR family transcriptional regulator n=1 Tax=Rhizobium lentis TaxID=1138194 RepID=A0A7W9CXF8_9HYPH|nr:helix-turn-helix domain-containing protein [Rhizobium lentis]MBB4576610.1 DNA-binding MarR family transcriptional regulator [Rhizobium lentis]MBB5553023.1 DNA-binding MarR family transcriptional regulator [Rhizobium lentis]MBB5563458.1 DNA-binding MarR family transcriptional regulator [Rhizobium lentis]MBB5569996.1 DNA-binding MarR family transcriptional regulator [Rhizobium lentis]
MTSAATAHDPRPILFKAFQFIEKFRELFPDIPMQTISVFLIIAMKPGISQRELLKLMGTSQSGVSRNVMALADVNRHGKPGLGLIVQLRDPFDARQISLGLSPTGKLIVDRVIASLSKVWPETRP